MRRAVLPLGAGLLLALLLAACGEERGGDDGTPVGARLDLAEGWRLQVADEAGGDGAAVATPGFDDAAWWPARVPSTVVGALLDAGAFDVDPYAGLGLRDLPGMTYPLGYNFTDQPIEDSSPFSKGWWYRREIALPADLAGRRVELHLDGLSERADVWVNGALVADRTVVVGTDVSHVLDVTPFVRAGEVNALALQVFASGLLDLGHTWIDWSPGPPDKNMGPWRPVWLRVSGDVSAAGLQAAVDLDTDTLASARLTVHAEVTNHRAEPVTAEMIARLDGGGVAAREAIALAAGEEAAVALTPEEHPGLVLDAPRVWWPAGLGEQPLYDLAVEVRVDGEPTDRVATRFGVREVTSELTPEGWRLFRVNGRPLLVRAAGFARDLFFRDTPAREEAEVRLIRELGLNAVRFEGKLGSDHLLDLLDEQGILVIAGWACCDQWERGYLWTDENWRVAEAAMRTRARLLRNRPSMLAYWYGSDDPHGDEAEAMYLAILEETRWPVPAQSSATERPTELGGPTGLKMRGPYAYVPPRYWLEDTAFGGAFGFATEIGPGAAPPHVESLRRMLGDAHLWPQDEVWQYHMTGTRYRSLERFDGALAARLGPPTDVEDYAWKAQVLAYDSHRAMFEGYRRAKYRSTGVVQWLLNNAWPDLFWHLYDWYLAAGGAFYGTRKANAPLHVLYDEPRRVVAAVSGLREARPGLAV